MLVDRAAGGFPIGLLANAQQVSALVAQYAPDSPMVRQRERRREALEAAAAADAATWGFGDAEEDSIEGHAARVPASMGDPTPSRRCTPPQPRWRRPLWRRLRATSAPGLKSTVHTRWLQRGSTAKGRAVLLVGRQRSTALRCPRSPAGHLPAPGRPTWELPAQVPIPAIRWLVRRRMHLMPQPCQMHEEVLVLVPRATVSAPDSQNTDAPAHLT